MAINLRPRVYGTIKVADEKGDNLFEKKIQKISDKDQFIKEYAKTVQGYGLLPSIFCPQSLKGKRFAKDLFCPVLANFVSRISRKALRVFVGGFGLVCDSIFLIPRMVATPFRAIYLAFHPEKEHPLKKLLNVPNTDSVTIKIHLEIVKLLPSEGGIQKARQDVTDEILNIALKKLPIFKSSHQIEQTYTTYLGLNGEWTIENRSNSKSSHKTIYF